MASFDEVKHCSTFLLTSTGLLMEDPSKLGRLLRDDSRKGGRPESDLATPPSLWCLKGLLERADKHSAVRRSRSSVPAFPIVEAPYEHHPIERGVSYPSLPWSGSHRRLCCTHDRVWPGNREARRR